MVKVQLGEAAMMKKTSAASRTSAVAARRFSALAPNMTGRPPSWLHVEERSVRFRVSTILYSMTCEMFIGATLIFNLVIMILDTDVRAGDDVQESPHWVVVSNDMCSSIYLVEFMSRLYVERWKTLHNSWNRLDLAVVLLSIFDKLASSMVGLDPTSFMMIRIIRIFRILRLVRALKLMSSLRELRKLIKMMVTCARTLFWSFVLTFLIMTIWSVILVEMIGPIVSRLQRQGVWQEDPEWGHSYHSVMRANLSLFQTIVAGDSWGMVPVPVIADTPWTALLFVPAQVSLVFGVLNLIVAVVVDTFADVRSQDDKGRLQELEAEMQHEKATLSKIFQSIDTDCSGTVTFDELEAGAENVAEFKQKLKVMDVTRADLLQLFNILDEDQSGYLDPEEFINALFHMKFADSRTATVLVKHYVTEMGKRQERMEVEIRKLRVAIDPDAHAESDDGGLPSRHHTPFVRPQPAWAAPLPVMPLDNNADHFPARFSCSCVGDYDQLYKERGGMLGNRFASPMSSAGSELRSGERSPAIRASWLLPAGLLPAVSSSTPATPRESPRPSHASTANRESVSTLTGESGPPDPSDTKDALLEDDVPYAPQSSTATLSMVRRPAFGALLSPVQEHGGGGFALDEDIGEDRGYDLPPCPELTPGGAEGPVLKQL